MIPNNQQQIELQDQILFKKSDHVIFQAIYRNKNYYAKCFTSDNIVQSDILQTLEYNYEVLSNCEEFLFPKHFLSIKEKAPYEDGFLFLIQPYEQQLDFYVKKKKKLKEKEALQIFDQIVKAAYSFQFEGYYHRNLRPEHFVLSGGIWKLQTFVYENAFNQTLQSDYLANKNFQPREAYDNILTEEEQDEKLIWDLGCILIFLLTGKNILNSLSVLEKYKNKNFNFDRFDIESENFSDKTKTMLGKMCHYSPEKRMRLKDFYMSKYICKEISQKYQKFVAEKEENLEETDIGSTGSGTYFPSRLFNPAKSEIKILIVRPQISGIKPIKSQIISGKKKCQSIKPFLTKFQKCKIMKLSDQQLKAIQQLFPQEQGYYAILVAKYCLCFVCSIQLRKICQDQENVKKEEGKNEAILKKQLARLKKSKEFKNLQLQILAYRSQINDILLATKKQLKNTTAPIQIISQAEKTFLLQASPEKATFSDVKQIYRAVLFTNLYQKVAKKCQETEQKFWAIICCRLTFSIAIDKLFLPEDYEENFENYFDWCLENEEKVSLTFEKYLAYLESISVRKLAKESTYILKKYYDL